MVDTCSGQVHDENAWGLSGVAGHAGLYSSALDLGRFCQVKSYHVLIEVRGSEFNEIR